MAAVLLGIEDTATILEVGKTCYHNCSGQGLELRIHIEDECINSIPDTINLPDNTKFHITLRCRRRKCLLYGDDKHLKVDFPLRTSNNSNSSRYSSSGNK